MMTARMGAVVSGRLSAATLQRLCVRMRGKAGSEAGRRRLYRRKIEGGRGRQEGKGDVRSAVREKGSALMRTGKGSGSF